MLRLVEMVAEQIAEIVKQFFLLTKKRRDTKMPDVAFKSEVAGRNTNDLTKLRPNARTLIKIFRRVLVFALVLRFVVPEFLHFVIERMEIFFNWNRFDVEEKNVVQIEGVKYGGSHVVKVARFDR